MGHGLVTVAMTAPLQQHLRLLLLSKHATISSRPIFRATAFPPLLLLLLSCAAQLALADCECGYLSTINGTTTIASLSNVNSNSNTALFTDLLETDFTRVHINGLDDDDLFQNTDWAPQAFNLTRERARGDYGEMFTPGNVRIRRSSGQPSEAESEAEADAQQLELVVGSKLVDGMVPVAELDTQRLDLVWGTFRASMKMSRVEGTCAAFFWYFNDTQEIDMEFLSRDFNAANGSYPVNLVLQSREAALAGHDASGTGSNFVKAYLPFDPTAGFHEYRIDYLPGRVFFYADGAVLAEMDGPAVPSSPGHLIVQHWSNGNRFWSGGPPAQDAALAVRYVKAYFNSSLPQRHRDWEARCRDPTAPGAVCSIPDVTPDDSSAAGWFFVNQRNMTNNQTVSEQNECSRLKGPWWSSVAWLLLVGAWAVIL